MKKLLVFVLICLSSTLMFAQKANPTHWTSQNAEDNMTMAAVLVIDGEEQFEAALNYEVGVFDQDGICWCAKFPKKKASSGRYIYSLTIKGHAGCIYTFRVWDHNTDTELAATYTGDTYEFEANAILSQASAPIALTFVTSTDGIVRHVDGYHGADGGYVLLATPVDGVAPADVDNMVDNPDNFDLYAFDQDQELEWRNYKAGSIPTLVAGQGYLYANNDDVDLVFHGTPVEGDAFAVTLVKTEGAQTEGWNLIGNPFTEEASIGGRAYYTMDPDGMAFLGGTEDVIPAMTGIMVEAEENGEQVIFTKGGAKQGSAVVLNLTQGQSLLDRAMVSFDGRQLSKYQFRENSTTMYIPRDNKDYAVVRGESQGEMPVSFKAERNGRYTISVNSQNAEFGYLHLIDNMTGADVDLLETPSYSFEATTSDYASRFRLVFTTGEASDGNFAFVCDGEIILNGVNGSSIVNVYDVTGRLVDSSNGVNHVSTEGMTAGVYMIQLVNGENVMTQKIVVRK